MIKPNLALIGFMGSGKTAVGRRLAELLGRRFVDCDEIIAARAGLAISEIFSRHGEDHFRRLEREVIREVASGGGLVIAAGGGAVKDPANLAQLRARATVIALTAPPEVLLARVGGEPGVRPLLEVPDRLARIRELLAERAPLYAQADLSIDTGRLSPDEVARQALAMAFVVPVALGPRSYPIHVGPHALALAPRLIAEACSPQRAFLITHPLLDRLYGERLRGHDLFPTETILVPAGERQKSLGRASKLYQALLERGADRKSVVIALGGGVIGDLAGFVAATYMRGLPFVQAPTTLLAQVDSAIGGKAAVDHPRAKNLIGAFYQPRLVLADTGALLSLSARDYRSGLAEVVKHALIADSGFFGFLEDNLAALRKRDLITLQAVVHRNCEIKAGIVSRDEREESGERAVLNLGHTLGHALEQAAGYGRLRHGEAIAMGLVAAGRIACELGLFAAEDLERLRELLVRLRLPVEPPPLPREAVLRAMRADKKAVGGALTFVLPGGIGRVIVRSDVPESLVSGVLGPAPSA